MLAPWKKSYDQPRQHIKKQKPYFADKGLSSWTYGFSSGHVWMWELHHKESWALKNCFWTVVLKKTLESPLDCKDIQPVHPKGNQSWIFIGRTDAKAETPILWILMQKTDSLERLRGWERLKAGGEGDNRGWDGWMVSPTHEFEQALGVGDGQGSLVCCSPWGCKGFDVTEWLNRTETYTTPNTSEGHLIEPNQWQVKREIETCWKYLHNERGNTYA